VALADERRCTLSELPIEALQSLHPAITDGIYSVLTIEASVASRTSFGGTAPSEVRRQIAWWRENF
jgi:argininosuccinate lyase